MPMRLMNPDRHFKVVVSVSAPHGCTTWKTCQASAGAATRAVGVKVRRQGGGSWPPAPCPTVFAQNGVRPEQFPHKRCGAPSS